MLKWALKHYHDYHEFKPNCTNFLSHILHDGGGAPMIKRYAKGSRKDSRNWWKTYQKRAVGAHGNITYVKLSSFTWGGSQNLHYFLQRHGHHLAHTKDAIPGDVVFYQWTKGGGTHHHTSMVSAKNPNLKGDFTVVQSEHDYKYRDYVKQFNSLKRDGDKNIQIWIVRITSIK